MGDAKKESGNIAT